MWGSRRTACDGLAYKKQKTFVDVYFHMKKIASIGCSLGGPKIYLFALIF